MPRDAVESKDTARHQRVDAIISRLPKEIVTDERYERIVAFLIRHDGRGHTSELVRWLAPDEPEQMGVERYRALFLWLQATGIPTLCEFGVITYQEEVGRLVLCPPVDQSA